MRKTRKILLSALAVFSMVFTITASAEELSENEKNIANKIPDTISINMQESGINTNDEDSLEKAQQFVYEQLKSILEKSGIHMETITEDENGKHTTSIGVGFDDTCYNNGQVIGASFECIKDIHVMDVIMSYSTETGSSSGSSGGKIKTINIKYSDTDNTNILNSLPDTINLDMKESEIDLDITIEHDNATLSKIKTILKKQLTDQGYDASNLEVNFMTDGFDPIDIHKVDVILDKFDREIKVSYSNTAQYNEKDATYVKNKVDSIKFSNYEGIDAVFTVYNLDDEENATKWTENTYEFNKLFSDNSIVLKRTLGAGGQGGGTPWGFGNILYFYKDDVLYATKYVMNMGMYGTTLENGTPVNMVKLEETDEVYKEMKVELEKKGLKNILGCYELEAFGEVYDNMNVTFIVGNEYNGKVVKVLHKKSDNTYETLTAIVDSGEATVTVSEFSPFMLALSDESVSTIINKAPNNAQTSSINVSFYGVLLLGSLVGIILLFVKKNKKIA